MRDSQNYNEFANEKDQGKDNCRLDSGFRKKAISKLLKFEIADKKTTYNDGRMVSISSTFYTCVLHTN